jgi:hypothetical protein
MGASVMAQCLRVPLDIPDGPGALKRLVLVSAFRTLSILNTGKLETGALGGLGLSNLRLPTLWGRFGGKNVDASCSAQLSLPLCRWAF